jgi:Na+/H+ antiporter NhaD/arsenite permease-like protein
MLTFLSVFTLLLFVAVVACVVRPLRIPIPARLRCCALVPKRVVLGFALAPVVAVLLLLITTALPPDQLLRGLLGDVLQPWQIVILFFSLSVISVSLDVTGVLAFIALHVVRRVGRSPRRLFLAFFALSSVLTVVTSNDIVVLTLTPIVIHSCSDKLDPRPVLFAEFFAANVWSSLLWNGNPTNVIVAVANRIDFIEFSRYSAVPTVGAGIVLTAALLLLFWRRLPAEVDLAPDVDAASALKSRVSAVIGSALLLSCLVALAVGSFFNSPLWLLTLPFALVTVAKDVVIDLTGGAAAQLAVIDAAADSTGFVTAESDAEGDGVPAAPAAGRWRRAVRSFQVRLPTLYLVLSRQPWALVPFLFSMFVLSEALSFHGWTTLLASLLASAIGTSVTAASFVVGLVSLLVVNLLNNQPATIFLTRVLDDGAFRNATSADAHKASLFALALASNYGANLTLIGALAGLMWRQILVDKGLKPVSYVEFLRIGALVTIPMAVAAFGLLAAVV